MANKEILMEKTKRLIEIDVMKGVFIVLMILCHFPYFVEKYQYVNNFVYSFHMYGFLLISGFLFNANKDFKGFFSHFKYLFFPYLFFTTAYMIVQYELISYFPSTNHVTELSLFSWFKAVFYSPIGTYWYIHTLLLCVLIVYISNKIFRNVENKLIFTMVVFMLISLVFPLQNPVFLFFFFIGNVTRQYKHSFDSIMIKKWSMIIPLIICCYVSDFRLNTLPTIVCNTFCVMGILCWMIPFIYKPFIKSFSWIGRNSFPFLLISPAYTVMTKFAIPYFSFDNTRLLWTIGSVFFVIIGCYITASVIDKLKISTLIWGRNLINV